MNSIIKDNFLPGFFTSVAGITIYGQTKVFENWTEFENAKAKPKFAWIKDASGDPSGTVTKGSALYAQTDKKTYIKIYETESMDINTGYSGFITEEAWNALNVTVTSHSNRLQANENHIQNNTARISQLEIKLNNHIANHPSGSGIDEQRIITIESNIVGLQENISSLITNKLDVSTYDTHISQLEGWKDGVDDKITYFDGACADFDTRIRNNAGSITALSDRVDSLTYTVEHLPAPYDPTALTARVSTLESKVSTAESSISTNTTNIVDLTSRVVTVESDITSLSGRVNDVESEVAGYQTRFTTINSTLTQHTSDINDINSRLDTLPAPFDPTALTSRVAANESNISNIFDYLNGASESLTLVEALV